MRDALRVLVVTTALAPDLLETWHAASALPGLDLHVAGALHHDAGDAFQPDLAIPPWGTFHALPPGRLASRGRMWWHLGGLEDLIGRLRPAVVHVHSEVWGRLTTQALAAPAPVVAHGAENLSLVHGGRLEARIRTLVARRNVRRLAGYVSWNSDGVALMRTAGLPSSAPTAVAPATVPDPTPFLELARTRDRGHGGAVRVGYVGRLIPEKGVQWLIAAMDDLPDVEVDIIGTGPYEPELQRQAARRGVRARFLGAVGRDEIVQRFAALDVLVVPSLARPGWVEQFGRVVCEAMLAAVPVIASDAGALPEVVGDGGVIVRAGDAGALRTALIELITDPVRRSDLARAGQKWALENLTPDVAARRIANLWAAVARAT